MNQQNHMVEPEELMAYLDGELPPERAAETAAHLKQCGECRDRAAELDELSKGLLAWEAETRNSAIPNVIVDALDERQQKGSGTKTSHTTPIQSVWAWLTNPKTMRRRGWQLAGVALLTLVVAAISIPNLLRSTFPMAKFSDGNEASPYVSRSRSGAKPVGLAAENEKTALISPPPPPPQPMATPAPALDGLIQGPVGSPQQLLDQLKSEGEIKAEDGSSNGPMVVRTAQLTVTTKNFDLARKSVDDVLKRYHGYIGDLSVNTPNDSARSINAKLRIPAAQLDSALAALKALGRVEAEAQNGEEVTQQYVDLKARLSNAHKTQQRLIEIQCDRTGKLSDVLSVELQISRVQGEIEQMEAQMKTMKNQVNFASLDLTITEQYKAELKVVPPSLGDQLRNAGIEGIRAIRDTVVSVLFWLLSTGPILLFWILILCYPARLIWKKIRPRLVPNV